MKHLKDYLICKYGSYNIYELDYQQEEYAEWIGFVEAIEQYEIDKMACSVAKAISKIF